MRTNLYIVISITAFAFLLSIVWEFALEDPVLDFFIDDSLPENTREKWKHAAFISVIVFLTAAVALPLIHLSLKTSNRLWGRLNTAQRVAQIGSWELDLKRNDLWWSDEIFRIFEIDQGKFEATYEAFLSAIHPEDRDEVNAAYQKSLEDKSPYQITHRLLMPDGRIKWVEERCETKFAPDGTPEKSMGVVQDITKNSSSRTRSTHKSETIAAFRQIAKVGFREGQGRLLAMVVR